MDEPHAFYLDPPEFDPAELSTGIASIRLSRAGGADKTLSPQGSLAIRQEHPPVERMEGDLGAICEVFRQSSTYFLSIPGVPLAPGDRLVLAYHHGRYTVHLTVVEREGAQVRIEPPVIRPAPRAAP